MTIITKYSTRRSSHGKLVLISTVSISMVTISVSMVTISISGATWVATVGWTTWVTTVTTSFFVGDFRVVTVIVSGVFYNLFTAIGKKNVVFTGSDITITGFLVTKVIAGFVVFYCVFE